MIGQTISHYRILEKIGEGGMGVVYKAEDTRLKRLVAIKFLPPWLTGDSEAKARFVHEARAAAALAHPNICTIHEIDEAGQRLFIVMEYVEGRNLQEIIAGGPIGPEESISIAVQIADGLREAHEKGTIHRDIKPSNVMMTARKQAKIMDFGLARSAVASRITKAGTTAGTFAYMSPEQTRGERVDHRTDIWSFGVLCYEMVTGQLPFKGEYDQAVVYAILNEEQVSPTLIKKEIPDSLERIVNKALEKEPANRYQSMQDMLLELQGSQKPLTLKCKEEKSIVVLPFENLSPDPEQEYFSDGLTDELISDLSHIHSLRVISRSSSMTFKQTSKKVPAIAKELKVQYVLEGSVRKAGNNLRITAQLVDAKSDTQVWTEKYSGNLDDVFDIQESVSRSIVDALKLKLTAREDERVSARPIKDVAAYEFYLKAQREIWRFGESGLNRAIQYLQKGLDIVGDNALLYSSLASAYWGYAKIGIEPIKSVQKAEDFVRRALEIDPGLGKPHVVQGWLNYMRGGMPAESMRNFKRALSVDPNDVEAMHALAVAYAYVGKISAALPVSDRMLELDPLNAISHMFRGGLYYWSGLFEQALPHVQRAFQMDSDNRAVQFYYVWTMAQLGRLDETEDVIRKSVEAAPENVFTKWLVMLKCALRSEEDSARREITPDFIDLCRRGFGESYLLADIMALLDDKDSAVEWLENALKMGFANYSFLATGDGFLENVRQDVRFGALQARAKEAWNSINV